MRPDYPRISPVRFAGVSLLRQEIPPRGVHEMKPRLIGLTAVLFLAVSSAFAQLPPLGSPTMPTPPAQQPGLPPLGGNSAAPAPAPAGSLSVEAENADLKTARA